MINDIEKQIGIINDTLKWAKDFNKDSFPTVQFKDYRRRLKTIREALKGNCAAAAYGESQVGKSYLMSSLLSTSSSPFHITNGGREYSFIDELNSSGGNNNKIESTGVITRFSINKSRPEVAHLVKIKNLSIVDIILLITDSYYNDLKLPAISFTHDKINRALDQLVASIDKKGETQDFITEDDIKDIMEYIGEVIGNNASAVYNSNFVNVISPVIQYITPEKWVDLFSLLWNRNEDMNRLFITLIEAYRKIGFQTEIYVPFEAVLRSKGTLLKIEWLDTVCGLKPELDPGEVDTTDIYDSAGNLLTRDFNKGELSALISEINFEIPESLTRERPFLKKMDLLDFPGARSREKINEKDLSAMLPTVLRRGKVAYLFNKYSRSQQIGSVLFCHHNDQKTESTIGDAITEWINKNIGDTPESRGELIRSTRQISPFFMVATKFNIDLEKTKIDSPDNLQTLERHWDRFDTVIPEIIKPNRWMEEWVTSVGSNTVVPFRGIYPLRDYYWSGKNGIFKGYSDGEIKSQEKERAVYPDFPDYFERLQHSFLNHDFVKRHFNNPQKSWDSFATVNNDGSKPIISDLNDISGVLEEARRQKFLSEIQKIKNDMSKQLQVYYEPEDADSKNKKLKKVAGAIRRSLMVTISSDPAAFGEIIDSLMVSPEKLRNIAYDIIECHVETPKDFGVINFYRASAGVDVNAPRETNIRRLLDYLMLDTEEEVADYFRQTGFELEDVLSDDVWTLASTGDVVTKHIIEYWVNHLNSTAKQITDKLPYADEVVYMLINLFRKLGVGKKMAEKIKRYIEVFPAAEQPNAIGDLASLTLNNFVSTVGREYLPDEELPAIREKAELCGLQSVDFSSAGKPSKRRPQPLIEVLQVFDDSANIINQGRIDIMQLRKLPFWNNYQKWENLIVTGLIFSSEISKVDPVCNEKVKNLLDRTESLYI